MPTSISDSIPNLTNGVSQQPATIRLSSQGEAQVNCLSSLVDGLSRRPPIEHVAKLSSTVMSGGWVHWINRDPTERYVVVVYNGDLDVYDISDGSEATVSFPDGKSYLPTANEATSLNAVSIADYTVLVNTGTSTAMSGSASTDRDPEAMIHVSKGAYGAYYQIKLDGTEKAAFTTSTTDATEIQTTNIASELYNDLVTNATGYSVALNGNVIYLKKTDGSDFDIEAYDSEGSSGLILLKDKTQQFKDLPKRGYDGFTIEIAGTEENSYDNWWVKYVDDSNSSGGYWEETVQPGLDDNFDAGTMPHQLVRTAADTFTFQEATWNARGVGDASSSPQPSFIGQTIENVFFHRNRLGFLTGENVVMSRSADFFNHWSETVTTVLDTDPIDISATHQAVSLLYHAVPVDEEMILTGQSVQFVLTTEDDILTPETVEIKPSTEFSMDPSIGPVLAGHDMYFVTKTGDWAGVREFYSQPGGSGRGLKDAALVTAHVPNLIPASGVLQMVGSPDANAVFVIGKGDYDNRIWVYRFHWAGEEKLQSSWSYWDLDSGAEIIGAKTIEGILYLVVVRSDGTYLEKLDISTERTESDLDFLVHLDRKTSLTGVYDSGNDWTTWTLPYTDTGTFRVITGGTGFASAEQGAFLKPSRPSNTTVRASGDHTAGACYVGREYTSTYTFSEQVLRGRDDVARTDGRLQLFRMLINYNASGYFKVTVTPEYRDAFEYPMTGRIVGEGGNLVGSNPSDSGTHIVPVRAGAHQVTIQVTSESHLPFSLQSAEWEGAYFARTKKRL